MKTINYISIIFVTTLTYIVVSQADVAQTGTPSGTSPGRETTRNPIPPTIPPPTSGAATGNMANSGNNNQNLGTIPITQANPVSQALIDACNGKSQGTTCSYPTNEGSQNINGRCVVNPGTVFLACR